MFPKVNFDVLNAEGKVVEEFRAQECYGNFLMRYQEMINKYIIRFYIPERFFTTRSTGGFNNYQIQLFVSPQFPLLFDEEKIERFAQWLNEFGITTTIGPIINSRLDSFKYQAGSDQPESVRIYSYDIDLRTCKNILEAKFALFLSRYIRQCWASDVLDCAFKMSTKNPELSHWDALLISELLKCRFEGRTQVHEYYMFSRTYSLWKHFDLATYREDLRTKQTSNIDNFYFTDKYFYSIGTSAHWLLQDFRDAWIGCEYNPVKFLDFWKNYDFQEQLKNHQQLQIIS